MKVESGAPKTEIDSLRQQKSGLIEAEKAELEGLKKYYTDQQDEARIGHAQELESLQKAKSRELLASIDLYQDRLKQKLEAYKQEETALEKSRLELVDSNKEEVKDIRTKFLEERDLQFQNTFRQTEDMRHQSDQIVKKAHIDATLAASQGQHHFGLALDQQARANDAHMRRNDNKIKEGMAEREKEREMLLKDLSQKTSKELQYESNRSQNLVDAQRKTYDTQLKMEQQKFKDLTNQQRENFIHRYNAIQDANARVIKKASSKLNHDFAQLQAKYAQGKEIIISKGDDPFYRATILQPTVEDVGKHYLIHLKMPEHEKEFVTFNANQRMLKMSFTRKTAQHFEKEDGSINKSNRSELVTKEITVPDIVNDKSIQQKYENGVLTFQIAKA